MNWTIAGPEIYYFAASLLFLLATFIGDVQPQPRRQRPWRRTLAALLLLAWRGGDIGLSCVGGLAGASFHKSIQGGHFLAGLQECCSRWGFS